MNLICKLFGHKRREWHQNADLYMQTRLNIGYWDWLHQCPRCGEPLKVITENKKLNAGGVKSGKWELEKQRRANMVNI